MNRTTRAALAGALTAAVAFGAAAPAAVAAPKPAHVKAEHKAGKAHKHVKAERLSAAERRLAKEATRKDAKLGRIAKAKKVERLDDAVEASVLENIDGDRAQLSEAKANLATGDLKELKADVRAIRPEVYNTIVNQLRLATRLQKDVAAMDGTDSSTAAAEALAKLLGSLITFDAETERAELRAAQRVLSSVKNVLEEAEEAEEAEADPGSETTTEPGTTQP